MKKVIKTVFVGTSDFGIPALQSLVDSEDFEIVLAISQPDKKIGRKQILSPTPIKNEASKYNLSIFQPEKIKEIAEELKKISPDLIIVAAYGQIIPEEILNTPKYGCVNIHGSLLPKYRGASCVQAAIINGDQEAGITIMKMDKGLDTGPIISQKSIVVEKDDTYETLFDKLSNLGGEILLPVLKDYIEEKLPPRQQDNGQASYIGTLKKQDGLIDWQKSAVEIERFARAMTPWPSAFTYISLDNKKKLLKIITVEPETADTNKYKVGEMFTYNGKLAVQCGQDALFIKRLQIEGKKVIEAEEFIKGYKNSIGTILG